MKQFLKTTLASMLGVIIALVIGWFAIAGIVGSLVTIGSQTTQIPTEGVLSIDMSNFVLAEQTREADYSMALQGGEPLPVLGLWNAVQAINKAAIDPSIKYILLRPDAPSTGLAQLEELRTALENFRQSGKPVIAYTEMPGNGSYYLATVADKIYMTEHKGGLITLNGLATQLVFLKDALDKLGVNVQLIRHGKYKSAGEMYIKNKMSPENREQNQEMLDAIWASWTEKIGQAREISADDFNGLINDLKLNSPEDFLEHGLVDELMSKDDLKNKLALLAGTESFNNVNLIDLNDYATAKVFPNYRAKNKIAIIYADGNIIDGKGQDLVAGTRFADIIAKAREDNSVKAIVFRINSPGGSVFASEQIKSEIDLAKEVKPVIASYGNYAASGGYWISNNCDYIFSDASTLTGSIGVFSMIPDISGTLKNVAHINLETVSTNKHGDMYSLASPLSTEEIAYLQRDVEAIYNKFTSTVAEGRDMTVQAVDDIAQGRVWAGADAIKIGLVDEIGTLENAINYAIMKTEGYSSDVNDWQVVEYPKPLTLMEQLTDMLNGVKREPKIFMGSPLETINAAYSDWNSRESGKAYAAMPYLYDIK